MEEAPEKGKDSSHLHMPMERMNEHCNNMADARNGGAGGEAISATYF
jgi:hypothetical protein